jgi:prephenate dehydratase
LKVAFQGESGAYSEEAIIAFFDSTAEPLPRPYLSDVFDSVENRIAKVGLVPVENTLQGSIVHTYDLLNERKLKAQAEVVHRIVHCLIVIPGISLEKVKSVYSHPQALGQCRKFLEENRLQPLAHYDTAGSVKMIKEKNLKDSAAIASRRAAEVYEMEILKNGIETHRENYTRFLVIGFDEPMPTSNDKTSIAFIVEHEPGTLFKALQTFAENEINLTKIESRPLIGKPWEYIFFIDVEAHVKDQKMASALRVLKENSQYVKILGSYPKY